MPDLPSVIVAKEDVLAFGPHVSAEIPLSIM